MSLYEDQLVYGIRCPVRVTKVGTDEALDGVVVYLQREKGSDGRRQVTYAVQYSAENCMTIESGVAADRIKYRAEDYCGVGGDGNDGGESNISIDKQKRTTCTAAAAAAAKRRSPSTESAPFGSNAPLKASGADLIRSHIEGDANELKELSSAQTDSASVSASIPAAISPTQKDETKSEPKNASAVVGDEGILTMQKNKEKKRTRKKKSKKQHIAAQASNHSMTAAGDMPLPQAQTQAGPTSSIQKQKQKPCTQEGDTDKEQRAADDSSHTSSVESLAQAEGNDHNSCNQSNSHDAIRRIPRKRSSGSDSNDVNPHPSKVAKRDNSEERADARGDASKGKAENTAAVRILTIPYWWRNQWGQEHRRQLYSRLIGKATVIKSSTNCTARISGHDTNERMRITIESLSRDPKSQLNSLRHANYIIENILIECLADENSKMRLLYDLALSDLCQLIHRDSTLLLLQKEILSSQASKSKEWWHLYELPCGREMNPHDLSSIRLKLPKESDCRIEVFGRSVKVSRESPYVLVSGTKQRDVKIAAMMVADAVRRHQSRFLPCPPKPKRS